MLSPKKLVKAASIGKRIRMPYYSSLHNAEKGHFVIYTVDRVRFAMPLSYLQHGIFQELLRMSEEEFGISSEGPIIVPCDAASLEYIVSLIKAKGGVATGHDVDIKSLIVSLIKAKGGVATGHDLDIKSLLDDSIAVAASTNCSDDFAFNKDRVGQNMAICGC